MPAISQHLVATDLAFQPREIHLSVNRRVTVRLQNDGMILHDSPGHHADPAFFLAVRRGARTHHWNFGDMPPVQGLSDPQIEAIVSFVRERQRATGIN